MCSLYRVVKREDGCYSDALTKMVSTYALFFICPFLALTDTHLFLHQSSHIVCISCQFAVCLGAETKTKQALTVVELTFG